MYWTVVALLKGSTGRPQELANDRQWEKDHVTLAGNTLTVRAPLKVHAELARNVAAWEQSGLSQIVVWTRLISDDRDIASTIGVSWRYLEASTDDREPELPSRTNAEMPVVRANASVNDDLPVAVAVLNERQVTALVRAAQSNKRMNPFGSPKVTLFNGQRFSFLNGTQRPFVIGIEGASAGERRPKTAMIDEGVKTTWRATASRDLQKVQLEGGVELCHVDAVRTASTALRGETTTIQIPRLTRRRIDVASELQDGQTLLIGCIPADEQTKFLYLLVTPRCIVMPLETK
jgi:Flp pilus assembly secretin CpaC